MEPHRNDTARRIAVVTGVLVVAAAMGFGVYEILSGDSGGKKRVMETVQLKLIPPPPPPKVEPPPEPPKMVEQKIQPPVDKPQDKPQPKEADKPPPGPLALDAKGGPGSDAFGLGGRPGGADLIGSGEGGGTPWGHYATLMQNEIEKRLHDDEELDFGKFRVTLRLWVAATGKVERFEVLHSAGDAETIERVGKVITTITFSEAPSPEMPTPIIRVGARPPTES